MALSPYPILTRTQPLLQAQKCFYEKAVADGRSHAIVAKLAAECAALYQDAGLKLKAPLLQEAISSEWLAVVDWNRALFDGVHNYYAATARRSEGGCGGLRGASSDPVASTAIGARGGGRVRRLRVAADARRPAPKRRRGARRGACDPGCV